MNEFDADDKSLLYRNKSGSVSILVYGERLRILYGNVVLDQTYAEFMYLMKMINSLYRYINEVRQLYYRRFLINMQKYSFSLALNSSEIREMYELLGGAKTMMELKSLINGAISPNKN